MNLKQVIASLSFLIVSGNCVAQDAYTVRAVALQNAPGIQSTKLQQLPQNTPLRILQRKGAWYQVEALSNEGWLKMIAVRYVPNSTDKMLAGTAQYRSETTLTTGVRGLSENDVSGSGAGVDLKRVQLVQVERDAAVSFAKQAGLSSREVSYVGH